MELGWVVDDCDASQSGFSGSDLFFCWSEGTFPPVPSLPGAGPLLFCLAAGSTISPVPNLSLYTIYSVCSIYSCGGGAANL